MSPQPFVIVVCSGSLLHEGLENKVIPKSDNSAKKKKMKPNETNLFSLENTYITNSADVTPRASKPLTVPASSVL
jgi:hypothetical protein